MAKEGDILYFPSVDGRTPTPSEMKMHGSWVDPGELSADEAEASRQRAEEYMRLYVLNRPPCCSDYVVPVLD